jgi:glucosamine-6-phosphate deaminase
MDLQTSSTNDLKNLKKVIVKKEGITYEISTDRQIIDLLNLLLPLNFQSESNTEITGGLKNTKQNFIFQISQSDGVKIKSVFKDEYLSGKSDLEELKHPFFSETCIGKNKSNQKLIHIADENYKNIILESKEKAIVRMKSSLKIIEEYSSENRNESESKEASKPFIRRNSYSDNNKQNLTFDKTDKIMVFSPHPDDEILGACGLLYKCFNEGFDVKVVYMTSGKGGGEVNVRRQEAIEGIKKLGGEDNNLIFTNMPFYEKSDRKITDEDYKHASKIIDEEKPTSIFICSDIFDPNGTHRKCYDILLEIFNSRKYDNIKYYFYYSVWYWPKQNEYSHILPYDYETYKMKIYAMLEHKSQLVNKFMGGDPRPFYQRATARDGHYGALHKSDFCEVYYLINEHNNESN